jgi:mono/diheme cytochrome c family protein
MYYTEAQANRGESMHRTACTTCHTAAAYSGADFRQNWNTRTAYDFFELVRTTMPQDKPASLTRNQYADIIAYVFKLNGLPGGKELPADEAGLKAIKIALPAR